MKSRVTTGILMSFAIILFISVQSSALDYPHTEINNISCDSCHYVYGEEPALLPPWTVHVPQNIDDTQYNTLCWSCHNDIEAPYMRTHSSLETDNDYGNWTIECRTCHDPHTQPQVRAHGSDSYLYSGASTGITSTTLTEAGAGWTPDEYQGLVLIPNVDRTTRLKYGYKITGNTTEILTVEGPIDLSRVSVGDTFAVIYGNLVNSTIVLDEIIDPMVSKSGNSAVRFYNISGANSFADGDGIYDGVCEVCHTETAHFTNDGTGTDQHHDNLGGKEGTNCISCHPHTNEFGHGAGSGTGCDECHGKDADNGGAGTTRSHSTHTETDGDDLKGPGLECQDCHDTNNFPYFRKESFDVPKRYFGNDTSGDGKIDLSETYICYDCHSPGGSYNGVNDAVIGAKNNWRDGVYDGTTLRTGKELWCAGCHDESPARSKISEQTLTVEGVYAANIVGDNSTYGYYINGHGRNIAVECTNCHSPSKNHIDHLSEPLEDILEISDNLLNPTNYRFYDNKGMELPRDGIYDSADFALCYACHDEDLVSDPTNSDTNFRQDNYFSGGSPMLNLHNHHMNMGTTSTMPSCIYCHDPHGTTNPRMTVPSRMGTFAFLREGTGSDPDPSLYYELTDTGLWDTSSNVGAAITSAACDQCHWSTYISDLSAGVGPNDNTGNGSATSRNGWYLRGFNANTFNVNSDFDGDGILNDVDNCPNDWNPDQVDTDGDGLGDDWCDFCPNDYDAANIDTDGDWWGDVCDPDPLCGTTEQKTIWDVQFGTLGTDSVHGIAVDESDGSVYVTGSATRSMGVLYTVWAYDYFVKKFDSDGNSLWTTMYGQPVDSDWSTEKEVDQAFDIALSAGGDIFITGRMYYEAHDDYTVFIDKIDSAGNRLWTDPVQFGTDSGHDVGYGIAIDDSGNAYVTGSTYGELEAGQHQGGYDAFLRKFSLTDGSEIWTRQFGTVNWDEGWDVAVDSSGNAYVTGYTREDLDGAGPDTYAGWRDVFVRKYDSAGNMLWTRQFGTAVTEEGYSIAVDSNGNVYVTGTTGAWMPSDGGLFSGTYYGGNDFFIRKYDTDGNVVATRQRGSNGDEYSMGIAIRPDGDLYIAGAAEGDYLYDYLQGGKRDVFVARVSGNVISGTNEERQIGSQNEEPGPPSSWSDYSVAYEKHAIAIATDSSGYLYITGTTNGHLFGTNNQYGFNDIFVIKVESCLE